MYYTMLASGAIGCVMSIILAVLSCIRTAMSPSVSVTNMGEWIYWDFNCIQQLFFVGKTMNAEPGKINDPEMWMMIIHHVKLIEMNYLVRGFRDML